LSQGWQTKVRVSRVDDVSFSYRSMGRPHFGQFILCSPLLRCGKCPKHILDL
jgi:hypothetical protein